MENKNDCCSPRNNPDKGGVLKGVMLGLLPHTFCIAFIVFSAIGATAFTVLFKSALLIPYFFHLLVAISFVFATISAVIYLKSKDCLCVSGIKSKWKYITILYSVTILVNLFMFFGVFPVLANADYKQIEQEQSLQNKLSLVVDIPCSGHSFLITSELKKIDGVGNVKFKMPNIFEVEYDSSKTSIDIDVFKTYKATVKP